MDEFPRSPVEITSPASENDSSFPNLEAVFHEFMGSYRDLGLPTGFLLNIEAFTVGAVSMNWHTLYDFLIKFTHDVAKRAGKDFPLEDIKKELQENPNNPLTELHRYIYKNLPDKLNQALRDLFLEARQTVITGLATEKGVPFDTFDKFARSLAEDEKTRITARMSASGQKPKTKRGQRSKWTALDLLEAMQQTVNSLEQMFGRRNSVPALTWVLLSKELKKRHPGKQAGVRTADTLRHTVKSFGLMTEWNRLKSEWALWAQGRSASQSGK